MEAEKKGLLQFFKDFTRWALTGSWYYHVFMGILTLLMVTGAYAYSVQFREGLVVTGMNDIVSWGLYISNFTFLVGVAAAAVMLVLPAYIFHDGDFTRVVLLGEGLAVAALVMCLAFVTVDMGGPTRLWHMLPVVGYFNWPNSMLTWDVLVLNGYLALNLLVPFYILYKHYHFQEADKKKYIPFVLLSVGWAFAIHLVTAFLYAGLSARPYWNNALLGPRFLASAFSAGPALIIIILHYISRFTEFQVGSRLFQKLAVIVTAAAQINIIMLVSELFKEFYQTTEHSMSAVYLFFGLHGHDSLVPWIWTSIGLNVLATIILTIHKFRENRKILVATCFILFVAVWIEKGMGLVIPGFLPSPLGEIVDYAPTWIEWTITLGIWAMGAFVFTLLARSAVIIEMRRSKHLSGISSK